MPKKPKKLFDSIKNSPTSRKREELVRLYEGYGFDIEPGGEHDKITHPDYAELFTLLPGHRDLSPAYFRTAIKLIEKLESLQNVTDDTENTNE